MPKFEEPYRVLEVKNKLTIWKKEEERSQCVNVDQVRIYHPRNYDTSSYDSSKEAIYEGKGSSNWSNRSNSEKSRCSRKTSGNENKSCKSDKGNAGLEDLRIKRSKAVESTGMAERDERKRTKICRKRSFKWSDNEHNKRKVPVPPQGLKRGVPSSVSSRSRKNVRKDTNTHPSQEHEVLPGTSNQGQMRRLSPPKEESSREVKVEFGKARETRTKDSGGHSATERRPVWSRKKTTTARARETFPVLSKEPL
ncbi:uncharacterized protein TNCV_3176761 [Trichonephila clavipes]|nr:uncharacterized protein TNCV_3176761 [Trichonephila clavipes]